MGHLPPPAPSDVLLPDSRPVRRRRGRPHREEHVEPSVVLRCRLSSHHAARLDTLRERLGLDTRAAVEFALDAAPVPSKEDD